MHMRLCAVAVMVLLSTAAFAQSGMDQSEDNPLRPQSCQVPPSVVANVQSQLASVVNLPDKNGGLFGPNRMWSAVVDRKGILCSVTVTGDAWPGSRAIAIAKATTANGFSNDALALSTANLYSPTQPGGSLYGLNDFKPVQSTVSATGHRHRLCSRRHHHIWRGSSAVLWRPGYWRPWRQRRYVVRRPRDRLPDAAPSGTGRHAKLRQHRISCRR